jgi:hypothetical protein
MRFAHMLLETRTGSVGDQGRGVDFSQQGGM